MKTRVNPAPLIEAFPNQLFEDFKKLCELKPFITIDNTRSVTINGQ